MAETLGAQLKSIRESRDISLEEIAQKTHIRLAYLEAIESGDTELLPSGPQRRGFLRLYANELSVEIKGTEVLESQQISESQGEAAFTDQPAEVEPTESFRSEPSDDEITTQEPQITRSEPDKTKIEPSESTQQNDPSSTVISSQVFSDLGNTLRQRRELLSLSIEDIYEHIHIRKKFLTAMEEGNFSTLLSPVQARGMLANYANFLNLDEDQILLQYADGLQIQRSEKAEIATSGRHQETKTISKTRLRLKNFFSLDLLIIAALFIGFAAFVIWGVGRILSVDSPGTSPTDLPEVADILLATGSPTPQASTTLDESESDPDQTGTPAPEDATPIFTPFPNDNPINVVVIPRQRVWVRVVADEEMVFEGRMLPGNAYDFSSEENLEILTGSAGAIQIYFNEQDLGAPGLVGQVVNLIFTADGLILPTPTNTPTITETPEVTPTPTQTPTTEQTPERSRTPTESND